MTKMTQKATKEAIQHLIDTNDRAVERALIAIYRRQTQSEQQSESAQVHNQRGFSSSDAGFLCSCAKGLLKFGHLSVKQLPHVRRLIRCYWKQLAEVAEQQGRTIQPADPALQAMRDRLADKALVQQAEAAEDASVAACKYRRDSRGAL